MGELKLPSNGTPHVSLLAIAMLMSAYSTFTKVCTCTVFTRVRVKIAYLIIYVLMSIFMTHISLCKLCHCFCICVSCDKGRLCEAFTNHNHCHSCVCSTLSNVMCQEHIAIVSLLEMVSCKSCLPAFCHEARALDVTVRRQEHPTL